MSQLESAPGLSYGSGKRALFVTEKRAFHQTFGQGRAVDTDERPFASRTIVMDGLGNQFLPGSRFSRDQHGGLFARHRPHKLEYLLHLPALSQDVAKSVFLGNLATKKPVLQLQPLVLHGTLENQFDLIYGERFHHVVESSQFHGLHRILYRTVSRHDHHFGIRQKVSGCFEKLHSIHVGHTNVGEDDVVIFPSHLFQSLLPGGCQPHPIAGTAQSFRQKIPQQRIVIHDQNLILHQRLTPLVCRLNRPNLFFLRRLLQEDLRSSLWKTVTEPQADPSPRSSPCPARSEAESLPRVPPRSSSR